MTMYFLNHRLTHLKNLYANLNIHSISILKIMMINRPEISVVLYCHSTTQKNLNKISYPLLLPLKSII